MLLLVVTLSINVGRALEHAQLSKAAVAHAELVQPAIEPVTPPAIIVLDTKPASKVGTTLKARHKRVANGEAAAYTKAYHNAERANQLLGEERYVTHPPDHEMIQAHLQLRWSTGYPRL